MRFKFEALRMSFAAGWRLRLFILQNPVMITNVTLPNDTPRCGFLGELCVQNGNMCKFSSYVASENSHFNSIL